MGRLKSFMLSAGVMAGVNILLRGAAVSFNAYVAAKIGEESMGLFTLVMSVYGLCVTFACSGVNLAAVRLTAERLAPTTAVGAPARAYRRVSLRVVTRCGAYSLLFSVPTMILLYLLAPWIGGELLCDTRTVSSLRTLAVSLPAISLSAALSGYFTGVRKSYKNAVCAVSEQLIRITLISTALAGSLGTCGDPTEYACRAVVGGAAAAEGAVLIINLLMFAIDSKRPAGVRPSDGPSPAPSRRCAVWGDVTRLPAGALTRTNTSCHTDKEVSYGESRVSIRQVAEVALPTAVGAYARQGLSAAEHLSIPRGLSKSGLDRTEALESYGVLQGMVFPLILFPSAVSAGAAGLLVPEIAACRAVDDRACLARIVDRALSWTLTFSVGCAFAFAGFSHYLGTSVYGSTAAAGFIAAMAPLVPVMYLDMTVDAVLKGLGEQVHSMKINVLDSALSLILVLLLVPRCGIGGYVASVYVCEVMNCLLSVLRLRRVTRRPCRITRILIPRVLSAALSLGVTSVIPSVVASGALAPLRLVLFGAIYLSLNALISRTLEKKNLPNTVENSRVGEYNI